MAQCSPVRYGRQIRRPYDAQVSRTIAVAVFLAFIGSGRCGLYDPDKPELPLPGIGPGGLPFEVFHNRWNNVIRPGVAIPESEARRRAVAERDALAARPTLTPAERVRLGIVRLRLREFDAAMATLQEAYAVNPRDFWTMTALGTAYQQAGQYAEAAHRLEAAGDLFPTNWPAAEPARQVEAAQLRLVRLRQREAVGRGGRPRPAEDVDDLFGVRFVGPTGAFEAGAIAPEEKAKLPADAIATVQQLLMWLPDDTRLYWLLGELYNAQGDLDSALAVFSECLDARRFDAVKLREHRQAVKAAIAARPAPTAFDDDWKPATARWLTAAGIAALVLAALGFLQFRQLRRRGLSQ